MACSAFTTARRAGYRLERLGRQKAPCSRQSSPALPRKFAIPLLSAYFLIDRCWHASHARPAAFSTALLTKAGDKTSERGRENKDSLYGYPQTPDFLTRGWPYFSFSKVRCITFSVQLRKPNMVSGERLRNTFWSAVYSEPTIIKSNGTNTSFPPLLRL